MTDKFLFGAVTARAMAQVVNPILQTSEKSYQIDNVRFFGEGFAVFTTNDIAGAEVFVSIETKSVSVVNVIAVKEYVGAKGEAEETLLELLTKDLALTPLFIAEVEGTPVFATKGEFTMHYNDVVLPKGGDNPTRNIELEFAVRLCDERQINPLLNTA